MRPSPSRLSMAVTAGAVTSLVVSLGVVFSPTAGAGRTTAAELLQAAAFAPARPAVRNAVIADPEPMLTWKVAPPVTFEEKPDRRKDKDRRRRGDRAGLVLPEPAELVVATFNVLGASHTAPGGKRPGMASGATRVRWAASLLAHHGVDVVGFQELQGTQYRAFVGAAGGTFAVYPGTAAGPLGIENSLAWRRSEWTLVEANTIPIPYFDGRLRPMPYVLLQHNLTGRRAWFANFHNPASNSRRGNNDGPRARAIAAEVALANRLMTETGYPVFITGDMNERETVFCRMTGGAPMVAANGGSNDGGVCSPPPYPMPVDWIFGSDIVTFTEYYRDDSALVNRISDHPLVLARAVLDLTDGVPRD